MDNDDLFDLSEVVRQLLVRVRRNMQTSIEHHDLSLSVQEAHVLILLQRPDLNTPMQLACHSGYDKAVITRIIKLLLRRELVTKRQDENDKRSIILSLTDSGQNVQAHLYKARLEAHQQVFSALDEGELRQVKTLLQKCI